MPPAALPEGRRLPQRHKVPRFKQHAYGQRFLLRALLLLGRLGLVTGLLAAGCGAAAA